MTSLLARRGDAFGTPCGVATDMAPTAWHGPRLTCQTEPPVECRCPHSGTERQQAGALKCRLQKLYFNLAKWRAAMQPQEPVASTRLLAAQLHELRGRTTCSYDALTIGCTRPRPARSGAREGMASIRERGCSPPARATRRPAASALAAARCQDRWLPFPRSRTKLGRCR